MKARIALVALPLALACGGCRVKAFESFVAATTPQDAKMWKGDPYASGGNAYSTGGLRTETPYGAGARTSAPIAPQGYDRPTKGSGLQPGEVPPSGMPWWATPNSPASQPAPETIGANNSRVRN